MKEATPHTIRLAEYTPYPFRIDDVALTFTLDPQATRVRSVLKVTPLKEAEDMDLHGEDLTLVSC